MAEDEVIGWHHRFNGHEFEQTGDGEGQGSLVCCNSRGCKESDMAEQQQKHQCACPPGIFLTQGSNPVSSMAGRRFTI